MFKKIKQLAEKYGVDGANILISWQVQRGVSKHLMYSFPASLTLLKQIVCLPKSVTDSRIESNFKGK
jgi:diketogulonate reductase-like aldo/keto reductase